jgi:hypothetical protein
MTSSSSNDRSGKRLTLLTAILLALAGNSLCGETRNTSVAPAKGGVVVAPVVYYTPETRIAWGVVGIHYFRLAGSKPASRLSHYRFNLIRTQNRQSVAQLDYELYLGGRFLLDGVIKYSYYPDRFYGIGNRTAEEEREDFTSSAWKLHLNIQRRWGKSLFAGLHLEKHLISMRETTSGGVLASGALSGGAGGSLTGLGAFAKWDSRDNTFSASRGAYGAVFLNRFFSLFRNDFSFGQLIVDARRYWPLGKGPVLAVQGLFKSVWGDCPFQALPMFGGLNLLRGYFDGRYRDRVMLAWQADFRLPLGSRFGLCAFAGAAQVQTKAALLEIAGFHAAGGAGLRYKFNRRENLNVRLDAGFTGKSPAFYLTFAEAF